jgi:hypothetical protein
MQENWKRSHSKRLLILVWLPFMLVITACTGRVNPPPIVQEATISPTSILTYVTLFSTSTKIPTPSPKPTFTRNPTRTPTTTASATAKATSTPTPVYTILRGRVLVRSNCRYGPGAPYLYKYGLVPGSNLEVIGRTDLGTWILVRAIGGNNPCWVKASLMEIKGDVMTVAPTYIPLPQSPYYGPPKWVQAERNGNEVHIYWQPVSFRAGDETAEAPYLIEAWICIGGKLVFTPIGIYDVQTKIIDEPGCSEPSHGLLYFVEKHGYSNWIKIPWPEPAVKPS